MRWHVEVLEETGDPRLISDVLASLGLKLVELGGTRALEGSSLEEFSDAGSVRSASVAICHALTEASRHSSDVHLGLLLGTRVFETLADGARREHRIISPRTGHIKLVGRALTVSAGLVSGELLTEEEHNRRTAEQKERDYQVQLKITLVRVHSAQRSEDAVKVQRLLAGDLTPHTMGVISDIVNKQAGASKRPVALARQWERLRRSINHPAIYGDLARHGKSNQEPPTDPMTLDEAQAFVRKGSEIWLEEVAGDVAGKPG